jgi:hypothetical protein
MRYNALGTSGRKVSELGLTAATLALAFAGNKWLVALFAWVVAQA